MRLFALVRSSAWILVLLFSPAHTQEVLPIDYFTRSDDVGTIKLSPAGDYLALTAGEQGGELLMFVNLEDPSVGATVRAPDGLVIYDFHWASNTRVVFQVAQQYPGRVAPSPTGEIYAVDRDGRRHELIYGYRAGEGNSGVIHRTREASFAHAKIVSLLRDDERNIIIAEVPWRLAGGSYSYDRDAHVRITRLDIYNGRKGNLGGVPLAEADVLVDQDDEPRFALGYAEGHRMSIAWRRSKDTRKWEFFELPGFRDQALAPLRFTADNSAVLFSGVPEGERYAALYQFTLADQSVERLTSLEQTDVLNVVADFQGKEAIGVVGYADKLVYGWLLPDHPAARLHQALQRAFEGNEVRFISHSADGKRAIVHVSSDVAPGEYFLFDTESKKADMIRAARSWVDIKRMRPKEPIELKARDGLVLHGYLTRPAGEGPHPLIVLPHGGPHGIRDDWSFDPEVQLFASRGYAVLQVNFRGSGGYGIDFQEAGYKKWGTAMQDDVTDATKWAIDQKIASADRICIYGVSYGGYAALMGAAREPKLYRCAIGYAGVYDLPLLYKTGDIPESDLGSDYLNDVLGNDDADLRARSPASHAKSIEAPVLLIHGTKDHRAAYDQAIAMRKALEAAGKPPEWLALSREGHGAYDRATRVEVYQKILAFLDKHLKTPASATN